MINRFALSFLYIVLGRNEIFDVMGLYILLAMHNSIVHTKNGFRGVPVAVAYRGKRSDQATTMFSGTSALCRLTQNGVGLRSPRFQKPGFRKHRSNIDIHASLAVVTFVLFPIYSLPYATS